jgi:hypothetical protein
MSENESAAPEIGETPAASAPAEPQAEVNQSNDAEEQGGDTKGKEAPSGDDPQKPPRGVQKRLDELTKRARDVERINDRLIGMLEQGLKGEKPQATAQASSEAPRREMFSTYEEYADARADFRVAQEVAKVTQRIEQEKVQEAQKSKAAAWEAKVSKAAEKYDDFEAVALDPDLPISPAMAEAINESDIGPEVAYWLGSNQDEAKRIAKLTPLAQAREIGKLEARLASEVQKPKKEASKFPAPIEGVKGSKTAVPELAKAQSMEEYMRLRPKSWRF